MIEYIECEAGDWVIVFINGDVAYEGHGIDPLELLKYLHEYDLLQLPFKHKTISDQDMEEGNYYD